MIIKTTVVIDIITVKELCSGIPNISRVQRRIFSISKIQTSILHNFKIPASTFNISKIPTSIFNIFRILTSASVQVCCHEHHYGHISLHCHNYHRHHYNHNHQTLSQLLSRKVVFAISKIPVAYLSQRYSGTHAMCLRFIILQTTSLMHFICNFCIRSPLIRVQRVHKRMHFCE